MFGKLNISLIVASAVFGTVTSSWTDGITENELSTPAAAEQLPL